MILQVTQDWSGNKYFPTGQVKQFLFEAPLQVKQVESHKVHVFGHVKK